ncbi:hypothetical protein INR49_014760 [Caranx melampygus]|nr:hypothetical protein INR49_014760 [Caranx melampygus]
MVGGIEAGRRRGGELGRGDKGGIKRSWLVAPISGASPLKLLSCTDDSEQGGGVANGKCSKMDSGEAPAQRPVTLDITVENESPSSQTPSRDNILPQEDSIDLGGDFATSQEDSNATPSESLMDKLNDQMMESVMISDSPNNSEENDVGPIDSFLDGVEEEEEGEEEEEEEDAGETSGDKEEQSDIGQKTTEIKVSVVEQEKDGSEEEEEDNTKKQTDTQEQVTGSASPPGDTQTPSDLKSEEPAPQSFRGASPKDDPVPVCTIFSHSSQPKSLVPDGFQPTLIKSPSFSMGSSGGNDEAVTPSKLTAPLVCQPSPSLSKFFTDNGQANPASDFFDSFTAPSSFISVSNPNAEITPGNSPAPIAPTPERQLSSTSSSISSTGGPMDSGPLTHSSVFGPAPTDTTTAKTQPLPPQIVPAPVQAPATAPASQPQPFNQLQAVFSGNDDPFATALSLSEVDRRHDAWLPSEETRKVLISVATHQYSPAYAETNRLTMPGLKFDNLQGDAVKDLMVRFLGEQAAMKRQVLTANSVEQSFTGLKQLVVMTSPVFTVVWSAEQRHYSQPPKASCLLVFSFISPRNEDSEAAQLLAQGRGGERRKAGMRKEQ